MLESFCKEKAAPLVLRLTLGGLCVYHGYLKIMAAGGTTLSALNISTNVHVQANSGGRVTISNVQEFFTEATAPEPLQTVLIGSGCLFFGFLWCKRNKR